MPSTIAKYSADQPRDDHGRWASGGDSAAAAQGFERGVIAPHHGDEVRQPARQMFHGAMNSLHAAASNLAAKAKQAVTSTHFAGASPVIGGGIELRGVHALNAHSHLESHFQILPHHLAGAPTAQKALSALHSGLLARGTLHALAKNPPIGVSFKNGAAPGTPRHGDKR